jgi:uncharacterized membrane protein YbhN (UPF0104 family)
MKLAEGRAARLEEGLWRDHQNAHDLGIFSRKRSTVPLLVFCRMSAGSEPPTFTRRFVVMVLKIVVSAGLLAFLFRNVDFTEVWRSARQASLVWLIIAMMVYTLNVVAGVWRWQLLLDAQGVRVSSRSLLGSVLVALFFNNFLPSNIGGDVVRIRDTVRPAGSTTLAATVVLVDRIIGLMGLILVAAVAASSVSGARHAATPIWPSWLWVGFAAGIAVGTPMVWAPARVGQLLQPLAVFHREWIGQRIDMLTEVLSRFRARPAALFGCFGGAVFVQATIVVYFFTVAYALRLPMTLWDLAVIVPLSFIVQMLPVSVNGFGVRELTFVLYFRSVGVPKEAAVLMSLVATVLGMCFSLSGAAVWFARDHH